MGKPVLVGYDPITCDRAPVEFGVAPAPFTGAPLTIASVHRVRADRLAARQLSEELLADARETLAELEGQLRAEGVSAEFHDVEGTSAPRAPHELAEARMPACWSSAPPGRERSAACCPAPRRNA